MNVVIFNCHLCTCSDIASAQEYFCHINNHLKSHETVQCMFEGCSFQTNVYGTFKSHKNRKHKPYTLKDFKVGIVKTSEPQSSADGTLDDRISEDGNADSDGDIEIDTEPEDLPKTIELKFASLLLKLENYFHVPSTAIDELLTELHFLISTASVPVSKKVILDTFKNHNLCVDQLVIKELTNSLSSFNPLLKAAARNGPLGTAFKRRQYYREHFDVVDPIEYILESQTKRPFQYVPILKSLQQLLKQKDILNKVVDSHAEQPSVKQEQYVSFRDGLHFLNSDFLSGEELRIS